MLSFTGKGRKNLFPGLFACATFAATEEAETLPECKVNTSVSELSSPHIKNVGAAATHLMPAM